MSALGHKADIRAAFCFSPGIAGVDVGFRLGPTVMKQDTRAVFIALALIIVMFAAASCFQYVR
jgi:hypothetical protein